MVQFRKDQQIAKLTKASIFFGAVLAVILGLLATSVGAVNFDIRDYLPNGTLFELPAISLELKSDTSTETLEISSDELVLETQSWIDRFGRLVFTASPAARSSSSISSVDGIIDLLPDGDFYLQVDQYWDDGTVTLCGLGRMAFQPHRRGTVPVLIPTF